MPEARNYIFQHTELAEILIKQLDIHEGLWAVYFEFNLMGANLPTPGDNKVFAPAAINFISKVGIQRQDAPSNLTVDAAKVNPRKLSKK
jgi:hypothetical protein